MPGDEQDHRRLGRALQLLQQVQTIHAGQHEIGHHDGGTKLLDELQRLFASRGGLHLVAHPSDQPCKPLPFGGFVVDHENAALRSRYGAHDRLLQHGAFHKREWTSGIR